MDIPREIYLKIFQFLHRTELIEYSIVCREWNSVILEIYYHELSFGKCNIHRLISALDRGEQNYFQNCHWVRTLSLSREKSIRFLRAREKAEEFKNLAKEKRILTKEYLLKFLSYMPNLTNLTLDGKYGTDYVEYLVDLDTDRYLTHLEEIHIDNDSYEYNCRISDLLNDIYYKFRASLKKLIIAQAPEVSDNLIQYGGIINYLNQFKALTHLTYGYQPKQAVTVYQLQVACPNLTTLKFTVGDRILEYEEERNNAFLNTSNLQSLTLSFPRMSASYTDMLIHHLPTKLKKLYIHLEDIDFYDWINDIGLERVLKLAERMSKLSSAKIQHEYGVDYEIESVHEVSQMTLFFQVLNAFKGDKEVFCKAEFSASGLAGRSMSYSDGVLDVFYGLKKEYTDILNEEIFVFDYEFDVPDKTDSIIGPEIFDYLKFSVPYTYNQLTCKIVEYSLTNCNYLQYFEFTERYSTCHQLRLYNATDRHFNYYTRKRLQPPTKTEDNLKVLKLNNFIPSDDFLHMLATYLPNVNFFQCGGRYIKSFFPGFEAPQPTIINLSGFSRLDIFNLNMNLYSTKFDKIWNLKINYMNDREARYYVIGKVKHDPNRNPALLEEYSLDTLPTITLTFNKIIKLIQLRTQKAEIIRINDGVADQKTCS